MNTSIEILKAKVIKELMSMGESENEAKKLINIHFNNALYLKSARKIALFLTA